MPDDFTAAVQAAAFHGLATNPALHMDERLAMALRALDIYEAEVEKREDVVEAARKWRAEKPRQGPMTATPSAASLIAAVDAWEKAASDA